MDDLDAYLTAIMDEARDSGVDAQDIVDSGRVDYYRTAGYSPWEVVAIHS